MNTDCEAPDLARCRRPARLGLFAATVGLLALSGCDSRPRRAASVDPDQARNVLRSTLEHWKGSQPAASLAGATPPITAQDLDWEAGYDLVEYRVLDDGRNDNANLRISVELDLRDPGGREVTKQVSYVVGTSPSATVFREMN